MDSSDEEDAEARPVRIPLGHPPVVFALPGSQELASRVAQHLGWPSGECSFGTFANGEVSVKVLQNVTSHDVFVVYARNDCESEANFALMRLLFFLNALRGESPFRITLVLPCLDYARQDRRLVAGEAIPPKLLLACLRTAGASRFLTVDLHNQAEAAIGPAATVLDELNAHRYLAEIVRTAVTDWDPSLALVCATNGGGMGLTRRMASELRTGFIMADRVRQKSGGGKGRVKIIASSSLDHARAIVVADDIFDTCGTLVDVCEAIRARAPKALIYAVATHGYFSGDAHARLHRLVTAGSLEWIAVTNSVSQHGAMRRLGDLGLGDRLKVVDVSRLLAGAMMRIHLGSSVNVPKFRALGPDDVDPMLRHGSPAMRSKWVDADGATSPSIPVCPDLPPPLG